MLLLLILLRYVVVAVVATALGFIQLLVDVAATTASC